MKDDRNNGGTAENDGTNLSRRSLLGIAGLAVAAAVLPSSVAEGPKPRSSSSTNGQGISPAMDKLSTYMSEAGERTLPHEVTENTKQHILDTMAAMISGSRLIPGQAALQFVQTYGGKETATVVASQIVCGPIEAALANGMLAHADETDDSHPPSQSHPGCAVVPAALASGERFGISGTHFLRAVALGYDVGPRVTMTLGGQQFEAQSHWSTHSISSTIWGDRGGRLRGEPKRRADAISPGLRSPSILWPWCMEPGHRPHPESVPLCRHDGAQRCYFGPARSSRMDRRGRHLLWQG